MATTEGYKGSVEIGSGLACPAGHDFPLVAAHQILARSNKRLSDVLQEYDERFQSGGGSGGTGDSVTTPDSSVSTPLEYFTFSEVVGSQLELAVSIDNADLTTIIFPSIYDGKPVTRIRSVKTPNAEIIKIPEGITVIESLAFAHNEKLTSLILPQSTFRIETTAFVNLIALRELYIPKDVRYIFSMAVSPTKQPNLTVYCASEKAGTLWQDSWNGASTKVPVEWNRSTDGLESRFVLRSRIADTAKRAEYADQADTAGLAVHALISDSIRTVRIPIRQSKVISNSDSLSFDLLDCPDFDKVVGLIFNLRFTCESKYRSADLPVCETCFGNIIASDNGIYVTVNNTLSGESTEKDVYGPSLSGSVAFLSRIMLSINEVMGPNPNGAMGHVTIQPNLHYLTDFTPNSSVQWDDWLYDSLGLYVGDIILIYGESSYIQCIQ